MPFHVGGFSPVFLIGVPSELAGPLGNVNDGGPAALAQS